MKKHLVYAEDLMNEILQYPSHSISKTLIRECTAKVIEEKPVSVWQQLKNNIKELVKR